ncbi:MAG: hypothetical protein KIS66_01300 [Fimbriimonadaceae bacterium]|nr:hypothetical protein [Fimbriimonadaceae bacterium]
MKSTKFEVLLDRHPKNPILTAEDWPYPVHTVFNPGATLLEDGSTLLLCRAEDRRGISHLCAARSVNGIDGWVIDAEPTFVSDPLNCPEELWGIEDPRITYVPELEKYIIVYTAFGKSGPGVALASTKDFRSFERLGLIMQADDKDAALFPHRIHGDWALIHRPSTESGAHMWVSFSPDLRNWGGHMLLMPARRGAWWDANKIGLSPPPIATDRGWLVMYHGVRHHASGSLYRLGLALFELEDPRVCISRGQTWMFGPEEPYETSGDVSNAVFPCGTTIAEDGDTIRVYYGAADTTICVATGSIRRMLDWLDRDGTGCSGVAGLPSEPNTADPNLAGR